MPMIIGYKKARELLYFGDAIDARTALEFGMVHSVVPLAELREASLAWAKRLSLISPEALYATKRAINRGADAAGFRTALYAGLDVLGPLYATTTEFGQRFREIVAREGVPAAVRWRSAQFKDRPLARKTSCFALQLRKITARNSGDNSEKTAKNSGERRGRASGAGDWGCSAARRADCRSFPSRSARARRAREAKTDQHQAVEIPRFQVQETGDNRRVQAGRQRFPASVGLRGETRPAYKFTKGSGQEGRREFVPLGCGGPDAVSNLQ
jgi:enoyl-CoA hydratase/isomerase-like protein